MVGTSAKDLVAASVRAVRLAEFVMEDRGSYESLGENDDSSKRAIIP